MMNSTRIIVGFDSESLRNDFKAFLDAAIASITTYDAPYSIKETNAYSPDGLSFYAACLLRHVTAGDRNTLKGICVGELADAKYTGHISSQLYEKHNCLDDEALPDTNPWEVF